MGVSWGVGLGEGGGGGRTSVDAEYLVVDDDAEGEVVKHVGEVVPYVGVAVLAGALGVEAVRLGDAAGLVVSSYQMDAAGVS